MHMDIQMFGGRSSSSNLGSASQYRTTTEEITKTSVVYGQATTTTGPDGTYTDIDGYFNARTEKELLRKLAKTVDLYDKGEGDALRSMVQSDEVMQYPPVPGERGAYILEWEPVESASRWNEEKDEMEYSDKKVNYYARIRIVR